MSEKTLEERVAALEAILQSDSLTITSPNGQHQITMRAMNNGAGFWINQPKNNKKPSVAIYNGFEGNVAVVGVWGDHTNSRMQALDACLHAGIDGGILQIVDAAGNVLELGSKDFTAGSAERVSVGTK